MNSSKKFQIGALSALVAAAILAGCSGGGSKSSPVPSVPTSSQLGNSVATSLTFMVGGDATQSAGRSAKYVPASAGSIVIKYAGDNPSSTPVPGGGTIPASAITAATINVNTGAGGNCTAVGSALRCTVNVSLPVGTLDLYIQAFSGANGTGTLLASSVSVIQLNSNGTFTAPGTTTAATPAPLSANIAGASASVALPGAIALAAPQALPLSTSAPTSIANPAGFNALSGPFSFSPLQTPTFTGSDGTAIGAAQPIAPVTITDADTSGNTCLILVKSGATTATPCPVGSPNSIQLTNTSDAYAVQWNGKFIARAGFNITATIPGSVATSTPAPQKVNPGISTAVGPAITGGVASNGTLVYDPVGAAVYIGTQSNAKPLVKVPYSATTGYGTAAAITVANVNGAVAANLQAGFGATGVIIGPDGNIWMAESAAAGATQWAAVFVTNAATANATSGATLATGTGVFSEYKLTGSGAGAILTGIASAGNYIWITDNLNDVWRINPSTASINPNKAAAYVGATTTTAVPVTTTANGAITGFFASNAISLGGAVWSEVTTGQLTKLTLDTSASPTTGVCTGGVAPGCIAAVSQSTANLGANSPFSIATDGTNINVVDKNGAISQFNQSFVLTAGVTLAQGAAWANGLGSGPDGVLWSEIKTNGGAEGITSLAGGAGTDLLPTTVTGCQSTATVTNGGTNGFILGPDNTLLFAPFGIANATLCGVIY